MSPSLLFQRDGTLNLAPSSVAAEIPVGRIARRGLGKLQPFDDFRLRAQVQTTASADRFVRHRYRRTIVTLILRLPLYSDDLHPSDMSDRCERPIVRHIYVAWRINSQDCSDSPKQHTTWNCRKRQLPAKRQTASIRNNCSITCMRTSRHNRH